MQEFDVGDTARVNATFEDDGLPVDPWTVRFLYRQGTGTITTLTYGVDAAVIRGEPGYYYTDVALPSSGDWYWRVEAEGATDTAEEGAFKVRPSRFT